MLSLPYLTPPTVHLFYAELAYPLVTCNIFTLFKKLVSSSLSLCVAHFLAVNVCREEPGKYDHMLFMLAPITLNIIRRSNRSFLVIESLLTLAHFADKFKKEKNTKKDLWPITKFAITGVVCAILYHKLNQISFLACISKTAKLFLSLIPISTIRVL